MGLVRITLLTELIQIAWDQRLFMLNVRMAALEIVNTYSGFHQGGGRERGGGKGLGRGGGGGGGGGKENGLRGGGGGTHIHPNSFPSHFPWPMRLAPASANLLAIG